MKKKITKEECLQLKDRVKQVVQNVKSTAIMMQDYGAYKRRKLYKLSENEYRDLMSGGVLEMQTNMAKLEIAEYIIHKNKLSEVYTTATEEIFGLIIKESIEAKEKKSAGKKQDVLQEEAGQDSK